MTRKRLLTMVTVPVAVVAVLALTAGVMHAKQFGGPGGPGGRGGAGRVGPGPQGPGGPMGLPRALVEQLDLTDAQREQIRGLVQQHEAEARQLGERVGKALHAQQQAITAEVFDESAIRAAAAEVSAAQADMAVFQGRVHAEVYQVLTAEQQAKARELKSKMDARAQERLKRMQERQQERRQRRTPAA